MDNFCHHGISQRRCEKRLLSYLDEFSGYPALFRKYAEVLPLHSRRVMKRGSMEDWDTFEQLLQEAINFLDEFSSVVKDLDACRQCFEEKKQYYEPSIILKIEKILASSDDLVDQLAELVALVKSSIQPLHTDITQEA